MKEEDYILPESRTICPSTQGEHIWIWDEEQDDYRCDECGVYHDKQED